MAIIESQDFTIDKLFTDFYVVPSYQREYVWQEEHITQFFQDIWDEFSSNNSGSPSEYFIGSVIVCEQRDGLYEVIDGQQRMTTAYLLLCAIRDYVQKINPAEKIESLAQQIASTNIDESGNDVFQYRIVLQYKDSCGLLEKIAQRQHITDSQTTRSSENIKKAYETMLIQINNQIDNDDNPVLKVKKFYHYFTKKVKLVRVKTPSLADALRVFETINNRGVRLDDMDLLKNLMFMEALPEVYDSLKNKWKQMVDILFQAKEPPMRFIRYFILSRYDNVDSLKKQDGIYGWFLHKNNRSYYKNNPINFLDNLLEAAKGYVNFLKGNDVNGQPNRYLINIKYMSSAARTHLMLVLAGQHLPNDCFTELCKEIENIFFLYIITREPSGNFDKRFAQWCSEIRKIEDSSTLDKFINGSLLPEKQRLSERFESVFIKLEESSIPKSLLRYILAKISQYIDESAYGSASCSELKSYMHKDMEIEHILPQHLDPGINYSFDKLSEANKYIRKLGNLTLLEESLNASAGNKSYADKKGIYLTSKLLLTKTIAVKVQVGKTKVDIAVQDLKTFDEWTSQSIEKRQEMLTKLAKKVWDMPE